MSNRFGVLLSCLTGVAACTQALSAFAAADAALEPGWRIARVADAPWAPAKATSHGAKTWLGRSVTFSGTSVEGPGALYCGHAVLDPTAYPAEGLFQGNLPTPAAASAQALGITRLPVAGLRLSCDTGVFEFHRVDADTMLLGLDNLILTLSQGPGAQAPDHTPEGRVQRLLEAHFDGDMGFTAASVKGKAGWLSARLDRRIARYFSRPAKPDEVPPIDGDPFTYSQEYPLRFTVDKASLGKNAADVPVRFTDGFRDRLVVYRLLREDGKWRVDDLRYEAGASLVGLMQR